MGTLKRDLFTLFRLRDARTGRVVNSQTAAAAASEQLAIAGHKSVPTVETAAKICLHILKATSHAELWLEDGWDSERATAECVL